MVSSRGLGDVYKRQSITLAIPLSVAGLFLTMLARTLAIPLVHGMDAAAENADFGKIETLSWVAVAMQGLRILVPALALCFIPPAAVTEALNRMPEWLTGGMAVGGGMVAAVGYAMVINMMSTKETWPFFALGFVLAAIPNLTLIAVSYTHLTLPTIHVECRSRWSPYH